MKKVTVKKQIYLYHCIPNQLYTFLKTIVKLGVTRLGVAFHRIKAEYQFSFPTQTTLRKKLLEECINKNAGWKASSVYNPYLPR